MTSCTKVASVLVLGALALAALHKLDLLDARPAFASPGRECSHTSQCTPGEVEHAAEYCVASEPSATTGHCQRIHILP
jgi:hypothetical protein